MRARDFSIHVYAEDGAHTLLLAGELDLATAPALEGAIVELCRSHTERIVLDLAEVSFIDSTGLRAILEARASCEEHRCGFEVVNESPSATRLFELTRASDHLPLRKACRPEPAELVQLWPRTEPAPEPR